MVLEGEKISGGDWLLAYNGKTLIGARQWNGQFTDVPAMGDDGSYETEGYAKSGKRPVLKVLRESTGKIYQVIEPIPVWKDMELSTLSRLTAREMPSETVLVSAFPNPFNPVTSISFGMGNDGQVSPIVTVRGYG